MEQEKKSFVHDTINLEEIRLLLGDSFVPANPAPPADSVEEQQQPETPVQSESADAEEAHSNPETETSADPLVSAETMVIPAVENNEEDPLDIPSFMKESDTLPEKTESLPIEEVNAVPVQDAAAEDEVSEQESKKKGKSSALKEMFYLLHDVVYLLAAVTLLFVFVVRLVGVKGDSMYPTLWNRDFLLLESNFLYKGDDIKYGDIVVLNVPYYEDKGEGPIVKRVIATEGQTVQIDFNSGAVYVDGVMLSETYVNEPTTYNWDGELGMKYPAVVPENCIFVLGDNRNNSMDSRFAPIGMIDERCVLGKVLFIAVPGQVEDDRGNVIMPREWGRIGLVS